MQDVLTIMGGALGLLVPVLFAVVLVRGLRATPFDAAKKARLTTLLVGGVAAWTALVWAAALTGLIAYHPGDAIPRFLVPLFVPVLVGVGLLRSKDFRTILDHTSLASLVGVQTFRLAGFAFLLIANLGILPATFASGGYGDIATGALALTAGLVLAKRRRGSAAFAWAFNVVGLLDLLNVAFLLLAYYPIWSDAQPSSAPAADFSLVMIPAIAAPVALVLHAYAARALALRGRTGAGQGVAQRAASAGPSSVTNVASL